MKIQLIFDAFTPEIVGGSIRAYHFCKYLTRFGHRVCVVTKKKKGTSLVGDENFPIPENCYVYRNPGIHIPHLPPYSGYIPFFVKSSVKVVRKFDIDVIHGSSPAIAGAIAGYIAKKITNKPFVLEIRDPWIRDVPIDVKVYSGAYVNPNRGIGKIYRKLEGKICKSADEIVVTNPSIRQETLKVHQDLPEDKFRIVYNAADLEEFAGVEPKKNDVHTIFYSGVLYKSRAIDKLIEAVALVEDVQLVMTGAGPKKEIDMFMRIIRSHGLEDRVKYLGLIPNKELFSYYLSADVFFAGLDTSQANKYLLPSKIFNYMAAGKPIIATGVKGGDLDMILREYKCGKMVYSLKPDDIAKAIEFFRDTKVALRYGRNGKKAVEREFNREKQTRKLEDVYRRLVE